jgi:hypothetical protein
MLLKNVIVAAICGSTFVSLSTFGEENSIKSDTVVENTNANGSGKSACANYGFPGSYRSFFHRYRCLEVRYGFPGNTRTYNTTMGLVAIKNKLDGVFATYLSWLPAKRYSPALLAGAPALDLRTLGPDAQSRFEYLNDGAGSHNPDQQIVPPSKHRGVFYNSATLNINSLRGFTDREEPAIVFGHIF